MKWESSRLEPAERGRDGKREEKQLQKAKGKVVGALGCRSPRIDSENRSPRIKSASVAEISSSVVETSAAKISIFEAGAASDLPVLVLLPGLFCSARRLLTAMLPLGEKTKLLAVEWRGHGKSVASKGFHIKDLATDVMAVLRKRLPGSKVCVLGHSIGARVLWAMLDNFKNELSPMLEGVAIIDQGSTASTGKTSAGPADRLHELYKRDSLQIGLGQREMLSTLQKCWVDVDSGFLHSKSEIAEWLMFACDVNHVAAASLHWDAMTSDYSHVVRSMNTDVLLMVGDATIDANSIYKRMGTAIPPHGAHFMLFPRGTHCPQQQPVHLPKMTSLLEQLLSGSLEPNTGLGGLDGRDRKQNAGKGPCSALHSSVALPTLLPGNPALHKHVAIRPIDLKCSSSPCGFGGQSLRSMRSVASLQVAGYCMPPAAYCCSPRFLTMGA